MGKIFSGVVGVASAFWLCYYVATGSLLSFVWHAKSDGDKCGEMTVKLIEMEGDVPRDFAAEKALEQRVNNQCGKAQKEAKAIESLIPNS